MNLYLSDNNGTGGKRFFSCTIVLTPEFVFNKKCIVSCGSVIYFLMENVSNATQFAF